MRYKRGAAASPRASTRWQCRQHAGGPATSKSSCQRGCCKRASVLRGRPRKSRGFPGSAAGPPTTPRASRRRSEDAPARRPLEPANEASHPSPHRFSRFVEVGRIVLVNYGPDAGKLATIIDIVDGNKCMIDGPVPKTGVARQVIPFKRLALTDIVIKVPKSARQKTLVKAWDEEKVEETWAATSWAKKLARKKVRASLTDFQRFQLMVARKQKAALVKAQLEKM